MRTVLPLLLFLAACGPRPEPLDLPEDPAARGVPVGRTTVVHQDVTFEVFYPAAEAHRDDTSDAASFAEFVPASVFERLGDIELPALETGAVVDAEPRLAEEGERYPIIVFSHGFGGFRLQSVDLVSHLASRGYVVIAPDHPGRMLGDVLPCIFDPPAEGCNTSGFLGGDPAVGHIDVVLNWVDTTDHPALEFADSAALGLTGHSAGGSTTSTMGSVNDRFMALMPMASGVEITRDVPTLFMSGTCDGIWAHDETVVAAGNTAGASHLTIEGAGHLAFSDLCEMDLGTLAEEHLLVRDDISSLFIDSLLQLGTDGCADATPVPMDSCPDASFLPLQDSDRAIRHYGTVFFDEVLKGEGTGAADGVFDFVSLD